MDDYDRAGRRRLTLYRACRFAHYLYAESRGPSIAVPCRPMASQATESSGRERTVRGGAR